MKTFLCFTPRAKKTRSEVEATLDAFLIATIEAGECWALRSMDRTDGENCTGWCEPAVSVNQLQLQICLVGVRLPVWTQLVTLSFCTTFVINNHYRKGFAYLQEVTVLEILKKITKNITSQSVFKQPSEEISATIYVGMLQIKF